MYKKNTSGFTLIELIVVITILAILGTIAYISMVGYSQDARNSIRISDMKLIEKSMSVFSSVEGFYPTPDSSVEVTYSGSTVSRQGFFWTSNLGVVRGISEVPIDPTLKLPYSYAVTGDRQNYQLWGVFEGWLFAQTNPIIPQANAFSWDQFSGYILGTYIDYARNIKIADQCNIITMPSLIFWTLPAAGVLVPSTQYRYVYISSPHLPAEYNSALDSINSDPWFEVNPIWTQCSIDSIEEFDLYIAQLSTAYQWLLGIDRFEDIIFNSNKDTFRKNTAEALQLNDISVSESVIKLLGAPPPDQFFEEDFTSLDNTQLVSAHTTSPWPWIWQLETGSLSAYTIIWNALVKNDPSATFVYPSPIPGIEGVSMKISFDVINFAGGDIFIYLRYVDSDNYYRAEISAAGYRIIQRVWWIDGVLETVAQVISTWSNISFEVEWSTPIFAIDDIEQTRSPWSSISWIWRPIVDLKNSWASIDNYILRYK